MGKKNFEDFVDDDEIFVDMFKKEIIVNVVLKILLLLKKF